MGNGSAVKQKNGAVEWYQFDRADDPRFEALAQRLDLHPLHLEDVHNTDERVKVEEAPHYTFALLKTLTLAEQQDEPVLARLCLFAGTCPGEAGGATFFLVVADSAQPGVATALRQAEQQRGQASAGRLLYLVFDAVVDSYFPVLNAVDDEIDALEDRVIAPAQDLLNEIFAVKRQLVDTRRILVNTRDAAIHLQRAGALPQQSEEQVYLRDLYDHTSRLLDMVETQRDLLNNALDIYLSSIANRTNEVVKVLTVLSTVALPALVVTGAYGMNIKGLPMVNSPHALWFVLGLTLALTGILLALLRRIGSV